MKKKLNRKQQNLIALAESPNQFLHEFNPKFCQSKYKDVRTVKAALELNVIKIRELATCYSVKTVECWFEAWLILVSMYGEFEISAPQSNETASHLFDIFYGINVAEITLYFNKLIKGDYGQFYHRFNMQLILQAAKKYRGERGKILSEKTEKEQKKLF